MKSRTKRSPAGSDLFVVSNTFAHLQERRHEADYDLTVTFSILDVAVDLSAAELAFQSWERIRLQEAAQACDLQFCHDGPAVHEPS